MHTVTVYERWNDRITESTYNFDKNQELDVFIQLCKEEGSLVFVKDEKANILNN